MATENIDRLLQESGLSQRRSELLSSGSTFLPARRKDIVGIDKVVEQVDELIHWLKNAKAYSRSGARLEPGVIFYGQPGTGKTLAARYLASHSKSRFINVRDWPISGETMTADDVRSLFAAARRVHAEDNIPVVLFWDEFESHAGDRDELIGAEADVVAQLTAELDGIHGKNDGLLLIGCTNYIHVIDEALRRPGRMGVMIHFHAPNLAGRKALLSHYLCDKPARDLDLKSLANLLEPGLAASAIEELCAQAWTAAVRKAIKSKSEPELDQQVLVDIFLDKLIGKRSDFLADKSARRQVAIHELGHALVARLLGQKIVVAAVRSTPVGPGVAITDDEQEELPEKIADYEKQIIIALAGSIAEDSCELPRLAGYDHDLQRATELAYKLTDLLSIHNKTMPLSIQTLSARRQETTEGPTVSNEILAEADGHIRALMSDAYFAAEKLVSYIGRETIESIAADLTEELILTGDQIEARLLARGVIPPPFGERLSC